MEPRSRGSLTGWRGADAILIGVLILPRASQLLRETTAVLLESTPRGLDLDEQRDQLVALLYVTVVHDLRASQIASGLPILTATVAVDPKCFDDGRASRVLDQPQACVAEHFGVSIEDSTSLCIQ